jgi:hypothetical protein
MSTQIDEMIAYVYQDPLSRMISVDFENNHTRKLVIDGDYLFNKFIVQLDSEIYANGPDGVANWDGALFAKVTDTVRTFGWAIVTPDNFVLSEPERNDWLVDVDEYGVKTKVGVIVSYTDVLGQTYSEEQFVFDEDCIYIEWRVENGRPMSDISQAVWTLGQHCRTIRTQLAYASSKPGFLWVVYGNGLQPEDARLVQTAIQYSDMLKGFGAKRSVVEDIKNIENANVTNIIMALDKYQQYFAGATGLPLEYYLGVTQSKGMSDIGAKIEDLRTLRKKDMIFQRMLPFLRKFYQSRYGVSLPEDLEMGMDYVLKDIEEDLDEEGTQNIDQRKTTV